VDLSSTQEEHAGGEESRRSGDQKKPFSKYNLSV
jgi:hypothetical protein